jgi:hypothetical protein
MPGLPACPVLASWDGDARFAWRGGGALGCGKRSRVEERPFRACPEGLSNAKESNGAVKRIPENPIPCAAGPAAQPKAERAKGSCRDKTENLDTI